MFIENWLVILLAGAILSGLIGVSRYMWSWNIADTKWKAITCERLKNIDIDLKHIGNQLEESQLPVISNRLTMLEHRTERLENQKEKHRDS